jgi:hypothetical protein
LTDRQAKAFGLGLILMRRSMPEGVRKELARRHEKWSAMAVETANGSTAH